MTEKQRQLVRSAGLAAAVVFAAVGLCFLLAPAGVLAFFNRISSPLGFSPSPAAPSPFFVALAASYMFVVTVLALGLFRRPENPLFASILAQAKLASAAFSFFLFFSEGRFLILLANGVVDGLIGLGALWLAGWMRRSRP